MIILQIFNNKIRSVFKILFNVNVYKIINLNCKVHCILQSFKSKYSIKVLFGRDDNYITPIYILTERYSINKFQMRDCRIASWSLVL